jgi:hypothetical protein
MKTPNHIVLDFESQKQLNSSHYWALNFFHDKDLPLFLDNTYVFKKYITQKNKNNTQKMLIDPKKFTIKPNFMNDAEYLKTWEKEGLNTLYKPTIIVKDLNSLNYFATYLQSQGRNFYMYINLSDSQYTRRGIKHLLHKYHTSQQFIPSNTQLNTTQNLLNVNFLRKERLYTKLKYSRSPAFDIVSGGMAALLAGFIGFLISEKFGYELADSGDFYYAFMYVVFLAFSLRPLLTVSDSTKGFIDALSFKRVVVFYVNLVKLALNKFK